MIDMMIVLLMPLIIVIGGLVGIGYYITKVLKKKYVPDNELILKTDKIKSIQALRVIRSIVTFIFIFTPTESSLKMSIATFIIICAMIDTINTYIKIKYIGSDEKYQNTKQYIISEYYSLIIFYIFLIMIPLFI